MNAISYGLWLITDANERTDFKKCVSSDILWTLFDTQCQIFRLNFWAVKNSHDLTIIYNG